MPSALLSSRHSINKELSFPCYVGPHASRILVDILSANFLLSYTPSTNTINASEHSSHWPNGSWLCLKLGKGSWLEGMKKLAGGSGGDGIHRDACCFPTRSFHLPCLNTAIYPSVLHHHHHRTTHKAYHTRIHCFHQP